MKAKFVKLRENAHIPTQGSEKAAGFDLYASDGTYIMPGQTRLIPTGLAIQPPEGFCVKIYARSGLASKKGITLPNCVGVIDSDYRGEVKVALVNLSDEPFEIKNGDRIAQMVISPVIQAILVEKEELSETKRAGGGFGSTGV